MSILLKLDSSNLTLNSGDVSDDFTVEFAEAIILEGSWEMALVKLNLWYSWYNISAAKANNYFKYYNGAIWQDVTVPDGQYTLSQLNDYLHSVMYDNGDYTTNAQGIDEFDIIIEPNYSTLRTHITLTSGYQLDFTLSNLYLLLGCDSAIITTTGDCSNVANLNDDINTLIAHCDLIRGNASFSNSRKGDVITSFVPDSIPGTNIDINPLVKIYLPIDPHEGVIRKVRVYITDNLDRRVDLNNEPVTFLLHMRKVK